MVNGREENEHCKKNWAGLQDKRAQFYKSEMSWKHNNRLRGGNNSMGGVGGVTQKGDWARQLWGFLMLGHTRARTVEDATVRNIWEASKDNDS